MTRLISLQSENVKRLTAVSITPQGNVVVIGGANGQGKSSVLDSIAMAFGGKDEIPAMPVRKGADKAKIIAKLDNGLVITRTFTKAGGTSLIVESADGARYPSPQAMLDALTGKLMFDPLAFIRMDDKKQSEALKKLVGLDFAALDAKKKMIYDERTMTNRDIDRSRIQVESLPSYPFAPAEPVSTVELVAELDRARGHNARAFGLGVAVGTAEGLANKSTEALTAARLFVVAIEEKLTLAKAAIPKLEAVEAECKNTHALALEAEAAFVLIDTAPITAKIASSATTNSQVEANTRRKEAVAQLNLKMAAAVGLTAQIDAIETEKETQLSAAPFPIKGLGISEDGVTFNEVPFSQASGAEQLRVSVAMSSALNPKLKVMICRDGSLLDDKSMGLLAELAEEHGLQVFLERVGTDDKCAIVIEDGTVAVSDPGANTAELFNNA